MIKYFFLVASFFISEFASSQSYFSKRFEYGQPGWWDGASCILQLSDGYILNGAYQYYSPHCVGFCKFDLLGNKVFAKTICDDTTEYFSGEPGSIIALTTDSIIAVGTSLTPTTNWEHDQGVIYFLNSQMDTLALKKYGETSFPYDTAYLFAQVKVDPDRNLIITGLHYPNTSNGRASMLLMKADTKGNLIWKKHYGTGLHYEGKSVICTSDGGYAIGGYGYGIPLPPDFSGDPVLIKTDSAGNQQWMLNMGSILVDTKAMICNSMDGNIIVGTTYCDSMPGSGPIAVGNPYRRINLLKVDNNGNILWNKKYGLSTVYNELQNIRENSDGSLVACGMTTRFYTYTIDYAGWIFKTNQDGDSLWYREYVVCDGKTSWNWLWDVLQTKDNGFIAGGNVYVHPPDTGSHDGWILKVDSLGCENPSYCWVGINQERDLPVVERLTIFPIPASSTIQVAIVNIKPDFPVYLTLVDLFGNKVKEVLIPSVETSIRIDISAIPDGLYLVIARSGNQIIARSKLLINKKATGL
ncbi:MAG: T9SS type A sorting domain-containing protein [bacterium]